MHHQPGFQLGKRTASAAEPADAQIIARWYTAREHSSRSLVFQSANAGWGVIVDAVVYGIAKYAAAHPGSFAAWRGIEVFLGAQTLVAAVLAWFFLGTANEVRWLSHREKVMANARVMKNHAGTDLTGKKAWKWDQFYECFYDPVMYFQFINTFFACVVSGAADV
jgi:ACS family allantoate permease-like MFS transporter